MWERLAPYVQRAPSPHNTQPARLRAIDERRAELVFVTDRGLPVGDPQGRFTWLTFGIVEESLRIAAHADGYRLETRYRAAPLYGDGARERTVAELTLRPADSPVADLDPGLLLRRRTNRHPYDRRPLPAKVVGELQAEAVRHGHRFALTTDVRAIRWVKELNRDALLHDLAHRRYRQELAGWLRFSDGEARRRRDGLAPGTLVLPGWLMRGMVRYHWLFSLPGLRQLAGWIYLRTMTGIATVGWLQGHFSTPDEWVRAGRLMLRLWLRLTAHGIDWQPYGSVITNDAARLAMVERFGMREGTDGRDHVWLLVRLGYCGDQPVVSERLPLAEVVR